MAAVCRSNGIGNKGDLPWKLRKEMAYFTRITSSTDSLVLKNAVVMGRKTWDSIPVKYRPLTDRINVVLSKNLTSKPTGADLLFLSLEEALDSLSKNPSVDKIFVVGGEAVYREALMSPFCSKIYLTRIDADYECDTFFPDIETNLFHEIEEKGVPKEEQEEKGIRYRFLVYSRVQEE